VKFRKRTLESLGDLVCGNLGSEDPGSSSEPKYFPYRSSMYITEFFAELGTDWVHDGQTRHRWVADVLEMMPAEPHNGPARPPESFCRFIDYLMSPADALNEGPGQIPSRACSSPHRQRTDLSRRSRGAIRFAVH